MIALPLLTSSRLKAARACPRLHRLQYLDGYWPAQEADALRFGTLVHKGLEAWWLAPAGRRIEAALTAIADGEADEFDRARAEVMLAGYDSRWRDQDYEVLGVEVEFATALINPVTGAESKTWRLGGKLDAIVREQASGLVLVVEHKTSSEDISQGSEYWRRLRMDGQVSVYFEGGRALGHDIQGCLYDVLGKPGIRPAAVPLTDETGVKIVLDQSGQRVRTKDGKKFRETGDSAAGYVLQTRPETVGEFRNRLIDAVVRAPETYFQRGMVSRLDSEMADAMTDVWQLAQQLREAQRLGRAPRNPDSCSRYGRLCGFFDACSGAASLDDPTRFTRSANVNPELAGPPAEPPKEKEAA